MRIAPCRFADNAKGPSSLKRLQIGRLLTHDCAHAEDREDLKVFEEGISQPKASHAAWTAAASSLQMRNALPEVKPVNPKPLTLDRGPQSPYLKPNWQWLDLSRCTTPCQRQSLSQFLGTSVLLFRSQLAVASSHQMHDARAW